MKRTLIILCTLVLCLGLLPITAWADSGTLTYQYYDTESGQMKMETYSGDYTTVSSISTTTWNAGWYVVSGSVSSINDVIITVSGDVKLILPVGSSLTLSYGRISISNGGTLTIYGQETGSGTLTLNGYGRSTNSGIVLGNGSALNIHGGTVKTTGRCYNSSVDGKAPGIDVGTGAFTVYGGTVNANAGTISRSGNGAGIRVVSGGTVNIHGGTVTATGASSSGNLRYSGAGIGGSGGETCGRVNITGGTVTAQGGSSTRGASAGIGGGQKERSFGGGGDVTISGGTVTAKGGKSTIDNIQAFGIGGAVYIDYNNSYKGDAGTFSTGTGGSAVIITTGGIQDTSGQGSWQGIIDGMVYGAVTLPDSQYNKALMISSRANLTIPDGAVLNGNITVQSGGIITVSGTINNSGTITVNENGTITGGGTINNTGSGTVVMNGTNSGVAVTCPSAVEVTSDKDSNTAVLGQSVTFTATVTGNGDIPAGTVQFKNGENNLGSPVELKDGKATYTTSNLTVGEHTVTAEYIPADGSSYQGSISGTLTFTIVGDVASISIKTQPTKMEYKTGDMLDLSGLVVNLHYDGTDYTSEVSWSADNGIIASIEGETVTTLYASLHNGKAITITYEGKTATTDALTVSPTDQTGFAFDGGGTKTVAYGDQPFTLSTTGGQSTGEVTYAVTDGEAISIDGNTVTILKTGEATITATKVADEDYNQATATLIVCVTPKQIDSVYQLETADDLFWFASLVNGTLEGMVQNTAANAKLLNDIIIPEDMAWTPIGNASTIYTGIFDGADHTISGMNIENAESYSGLFGNVTGTVKNFTVTGNITLTGSESITKVGGVVGSLGTASAGGTLSGVTSGVNITVNSGNDHIGGVVGSLPENSSPTVENCVYTGNINVPVAAGSVAGVVGYIRTGYILNCANRGTVSIKGTGNGSVGGILGYCNNGEIYIRNCYNSGTISAEGTANVGAIVGQNKGTQATVSNCYYQEGCASKGQGQLATDAAGTVIKTGDQFVSGEVAVLLQGDQTVQTWGQAIGTDDYPVLTADEAKRVYTYNVYNGSDAAEPGYANDGVAIGLEGNAVAVVETAGFTTADDNANVIVKDGNGAYTCANLVLTDGADFYTPVTFTAGKATYSRILPETSTWGTIVLPFEATTTDASLYEATDVVDAGSEESILAVQPLTGGALEAHTPALFQGETERTTLTFSASDAEVAATADAVLTKAIGENGYTLTGSLSTIDALTEGDLFIAKDMFWSVGTENTVGMQAFRAYIDAPEAGPAQVNALRILIGDATSIRQALSDGTLPVDVYSLQGVQLRKNVARDAALEGLPAGIYIVGGKKVVKK